MYNSLISFDGIKYYPFKRENVEPIWWTKKMDYIIEYTEREAIKCDGYFDRDAKIICFFYNRKINKEYKELIIYQKLERIGQAFLTSDQEGKEKNMSVKELEGIKSGRVDLEDAPITLVPTRIQAGLKIDPADDVECLYVDFFWMEGKDEKTLTMKYRPFHVKELLARMKTLKIKNIADYVNETWEYTRKPFGTLGYEKYLPVLPLVEEG